MSENLKIPQTIYLAVWTHLQGQDISAHTTEKGAYEQCAAWSHESLNQWEDANKYIAKFANYTHEELCANWCEITDYTEFLRVDTALLIDDTLDNIDAESEKD